MAVKKIFKSSLPHLVFVTKKGKNLMFTNHKHITDNAQDISELEDEIKSQHPHIFVDLAEAHIDTTLQEEIAKAQREATLGVMEKFARKNIEEGKNPDGSATAGETVAASTAGNTVEAVLNVPTLTASMSAATLLGAVSSASLAGLSSPSNSK